MGYMMNSVQLEGRLTADPELRYTQGENSFATMRFRLASDNGKDRNGNERPAAFVTCSATGKTAELLEQYCRKGDTILIEGKINAGSYKDRNGNTQYYTQVDVSRVYFVNVTGKDGQRQQGAPAADSARQQARQGQQGQQDGRSPAGQPGGRQSGAGAASGQGSRQGQQGRQSGQTSNGQASGADGYYSGMADDWNDAGYDEPPFY